MESCSKEAILQRIKDFREYTAMSKSTLALSIGMEQTTLNNQFLGKRGLSLDLIIGILSTFSEVSAEWLLRDRGDMLISKFGESTESITLKYNEKLEKLVDTISTLQEVINEKNKVNQIILEENNRLKGELIMLKNERNAK